MRIQVPKEFTEDEIAVTANIFFWHFANDLGSFINNFMKQKYGPAWFQDLRANNAQYRNFNLKDPAALLKDLSRNGSSQLRQAIHSKVERGFQKEFYDDLEGLLGERNAWYHRNLPETTTALLDLITSIVRSSQKLGLPVVEDCLLIQRAIFKPETELPTDMAVETPITVEVVQPEPVVEIPAAPASEVIEEVIKTPESALAAEIIEIAGIETSQIGDEVVGNLLSHSYVLHTTGEIRNRMSNELLSAVNPQSASALGSFLIARKPSGGRIRITEEGVLCAFFEDQWGYLAKVKSEDWFPDHLHHKAEKK